MPTGNLRVFLMTHLLWCNSAEQQNLVRKTQSFGLRATTVVSPVFTILNDTQRTMT